MLEEQPPQFSHPTEMRLWELGNESARKDIADIDAEIRGRWTIEPNLRW